MIWLDYPEELVSYKDKEGWTRVIPLEDWEDVSREGISLFLSSNTWVRVNGPVYRCKETQQLATATFEDNEYSLTGITKK